MTYRLPLLNKGHKLFFHLEESPGIAVDLVEAGEGCFSYPWWAG